LHKKLGHTIIIKYEVIQEVHQIITRVELIHKILHIETIIQFVKNNNHVGKINSINPTALVKINFRHMKLWSRFIPPVQQNQRKITLSNKTANKEKIYMVKKKH